MTRAARVHRECRPQLNSLGKSNRSRNSPRPSPTHNRRQMQRLEHVVGRRVESSPRSPLASQTKEGSPHATPQKYLASRELPVGGGGPRVGPPPPWGASNGDTGATPVDRAPSPGEEAAPEAKEPPWEDPCTGPSG